MKKILSLFIFLLSFWLVVKPVMAATLSLDAIGEDSVEGTVFTSWTYADVNPILMGKASPNASVSIKIDDLTNTVTADTSGEWTFIPTTLTDGTYTIIITSGVESMTFDLSIGATSTTTSSSTTTSTTTTTPTAIPTTKVSTTTTSSTTSTSSATTEIGRGGASSETTTLPQTGAVEQTFFVFSAGLFLLGIGLMARTKIHS